MRILFAGSPSIAVPSLVRIAASQKVVGILTNPESASGRGRDLRPTPVAQSAKDLFGASVPIFTPERLDSAAREALAELAPDLLVSFAYGKIFGPKFLGIFPKGGVNVHPSLLPRHRGSSPIQQAILEGDDETGVTVQRLAVEMDSGDILGVRKITLSGKEDAESLSLTCGEIGAALLETVVAQIEAGTERAEPQLGEASYCRKISKLDGLVDWTMPCDEIDARVRAFTPWPGSFTFLRGQRLNILKCKPYADERFEGAGLKASEAGGTDGQDSSWDAMTKTLPGTILSFDTQKGILVRAGEGMLGLETLQFATKKALSWKEFRNGAGDILGLSFANE